MGVAACASSGGSGPNRDQTNAASTSIIGGHLDTTTKGVVALTRSAHGLVGVICSGSLLAPNLVLTARHCVSRIDDGSSEAVDCDNSRFTARYDPHQLFISTDSQPRSGSKLYTIEEVHESPGRNVCGYDIALLILSGAGVPTSEAKPLEPVLDHQPTARQAFAAVGYGLQDPDDAQGDTGGTRMRFEKSSVSCVGQKCPLAAAVEDDEFVGDSPVCSGDSGGPALDAEGRVFGVTSRGDNQCTYALYSNVADWADLVRRTAITAATSGGYTPPTWATGSTGASGTGGGSNDGGGSATAGSASAGSASAGSAMGGRPAGSNATGGNATGGNATDPAGTTSPPAGPAKPTVDPTGSACAGSTDCPGTYLCYAATRSPPGICVPLCAASTNRCPADYRCSETLGVCTPVQTTTKTAHLAGSCALSQGSNSAAGSSAFATLLALCVLWFGRRHRRDVA